MRHLSWLLLSTLVLSTTSCGAHSLRKDTAMNTQLPTQKYCFGRYEIELSNFMYMNSGRYSFENFDIEIVRAVRTDYPTIEKDWVSYISNKVSTDVAISPGSRIINKDMKNNPRLMLEYIDTSKEASKRLNAIYMFHPYYLKSVVERKEWILATGRTIEIPRPQSVDGLERELKKELMHKYVIYRK